MKLAKSSPLVLLGLGAVLVVVFVAALFAIGDSSDTLAPALQDAPSSGSHAPSAQLVFESVDDVIERDREPAASASTQFANTDLAALGHLHIAGTVVVVDRDGLERRDQSGHMYLAFDHGHGIRNVSVEVTAGSWSATFDQEPDGTYVEAGSDDPDNATHFEADFRNSLISVRSVRFNDAGSFRGLEDLQRFVFGEEQAEFRLHLIAPIRVAVRDATSGAHLNQVTILVASRETGDGPVHPAKSFFGSYAEDAASPIDIDPETASHNGDVIECLVGSPGYTWTKFALDFTAAETQLVSLKRGGILEVSHNIPLPASMFVLSLYKPDTRKPIARHSLQDTGTLLFTGLLPGEYDLRVELNGHYDRQGLEVWARSKAQVLAGQRTQVTLDLTAPNPNQEAPVSGQLVLPHVWQLKQFSVRLRPIAGGALRAATRDRAALRELFRSRDGSPPTATHETVLDQDAFVRNLNRKDTFDFDLGELATGTYEMTFQGLGFQTVFDVGPEGRSDIRFVIPEPAWVTVHVRDALTGEAVNVHAIHWKCKSMGASGQSEAAEAIGASQFQIQVPQAALVFWIPATVDVSSRRFDRRLFRRYDERFGARDKVEAEDRVEVQAEPGLQITLEVQPACGVRLELQSGGTLIPWPEHASAEATQLDGSGRSTGLTKTQRGMQLTVSEPGRYLIIPPELLGFHAPGPVQIEVSEGEFKELIIQLEPETP